MDVAINLSHVVVYVIILDVSAKTERVNQFKDWITHISTPVESPHKEVWTPRKHRYCEFLVAYKKEPQTYKSTSIDWVSADNMNQCLVV